MTWDHPRAWGPLDGAAATFAAMHPGLDIVWDRRSLREFGEAPIEQYAQRYDLLVIDYPFSGFASRHPWLLDWAGELTAAEHARFAADSVGASWTSYHHEGHVWALPIDAATQVSSCRPDLLARLDRDVPATFDEVLALAAKARAAGQWIVTTAFPTDAISTVVSIAGSLGHCIVDGCDEFLPPAVGREVLQRLHALVDAAHPDSVRLNPIQAYDRMSAADDIVYCAYGYGYSNYARPDRARRLRFCDVPAHADRGPAGTQLGGTGIAVSALSEHRALALAYARWLASAAHQRGEYYRLGGQPASLGAWQSPELDADCFGFFSGTMATMTGALVRPRFDGWIPFFEAAGEEVTRCLKREITDRDLASRLNAAFDKARGA